MAVATNPRGIPQALFVNDVEEYMAQRADAQEALDELDQQYSKYKFMETNHLQRKAVLVDKLPEIERTLEALRFLQTKKDSDDPIYTQFEMSETLFAKASITRPEKVCLWLGANVMLEYDLDEAEALLVKNQESARTNLKIVNEDLEFLREQIVTTEVGVARIHNWDVKRRRNQSQKAA